MYKHGVMLRDDQVRGWVKPENKEWERNVDEEIQCAEKHYALACGIRARMFWHYELIRLRKDKAETEEYNAARRKEIEEEKSARDSSAGQSATREG